jgi:hypothetical protein
MIALLEIAAIQLAFAIAAAITGGRVAIRAVIFVIEASAAPPRIGAQRSYVKRPDARSVDG